MVTIVYARKRDN